MALSVCAFVFANAKGMFPHDRTLREIISSLFSPFTLHMCNVHIQTKIMEINRVCRFHGNF